MKMDELEFRYMYNPSYMPIANPIEECFSVAKQAYKKAKINKIACGVEVEHEKFIKKGFEKVDSELVKGCIRHSDR